MLVIDGRGLMARPLLYNSLEIGEHGCQYRGGFRFNIISASIRDIRASCGIGKLLLEIVEESEQPSNGARRSCSYVHA